MDVLNIENTLIKHIDQSPETFLKKTIVLFGPTNTGKTFIIKHILKLLNEHVPMCLAFVPTDNPEGEDSYNKIINPRCVIRNLNTAVERLRILFARQSQGRETVSKINNLPLLKKLYERNRVDKTDVFIRQINSAADSGKDIIMRDSFKSSDEKMSEIKEIEKIRNNKLIKQYKENILRFQSTLIKEHNDKTNVLNENEMFIVKYINYNNNIVVIFDDCMAEINKWGKDDEIKQIFFQGRHIGITTLFVMHSDKGFPPDLRNNAFINIFTSPTVAVNYFRTKNNGISNELSKKLEKIIAKLFKKSQDPHSPSNHKKLVFIPLDAEQQIQYIIAKNHQDFKFGCKGLDKLTDAMKEHEDKSDKPEGKKLFTV